LKHGGYQGLNSEPSEEDRNDADREASPFSQDLVRGSVGDGGDVLEGLKRTSVNSLAAAWSTVHHVPDFRYTQLLSVISHRVQNFRNYVHGHQAHNEKAESPGGTWWKTRYLS